MNPEPLLEKIDTLSRMNESAGEITRQISQGVAVMADQLAAQSHAGMLVTGLTIFVLAVFVGYHVVWRVTPALHSPLMAVTNAISSVIIVGALIAAGTAKSAFGGWLGFAAVTLASVNIFGGFIVTQRMLAMFKKRETKTTEAKS